MKKELHLITGKGRMGQCDFHPKGSLHMVEVIDGRRTTRSGRQDIHHDIESKWLVKGSMEQINYQLGIGLIKKCESYCKNTFIKDAEFHTEKECIRCYEKRTKVNRY